MNSSIDCLPSAHQERLAEIVEACMVALEQGNSFEADRIVAAHPEFAEPLKKCVESLRTLHAAVHCVDDTLPSHPMLQVGGQLGDFVLGEMIGRGGMGIVYAAKQCSLDRQVAIKLLPLSVAMQPMQLKRFLLEAKAVAQLQHPNIVPIYSVGEDSGIHYHAMQLIDGHSLDKGEVGRWGKGDLRSFLDVAISVAEALHHAHDCGIIHRDVKPSNLLLDSSGKVWVTDFGLARCTRETGLTLSGDLLGTVNYMSPEQAMGKPVDQRTDIYSLGVTLYEMLTGQQAFSGKAGPEVCRRIERDEPVAPRKLNARIPYDLETVLLKAMSKDREDRYLTAADFAFDLMAVRDGRPIAGRRPSWLQHGIRWLKQHKTLTFVGMLGGLATIAALLVGSAQVWLARQELQLALTKSEERRLFAEETYWQARSLLNRWNHEVITPLGDIAGADEVRSRMLADTIAYYESFLEKSVLSEHLRDDPELVSDMANARAQLAASLMQAGLYAKAQRNFEMAIADWQKVDRREDDQKLAVATNDLGLAYLNQGDAKEAIKQLQLSLQVYASLNANQQQDIRADVAPLHVNLARAFGQLGDSQRELSSLDTAADLYRQLLKDDPQRTELASEFATVLDHLALQHAHTKPAKGVELGEEAVAIHERCTTSDRGSPKYAQRLGASLHNLAVLLFNDGQKEAARRRFHEAVATKLELTSTHASWPSHWRELALSQRGLAELECELGCWQESQTQLEGAKESLEHLVGVIDRRPSQVTNWPWQVSWRKSQRSNLETSVGRRVND